MLAMDISFSKTLNPSFSPIPLRSKTLTPKTKLTPTISLSLQNPNARREIRAFAGRSKKKPGGPSPGRIEGNAEFRRRAKKKSRVKQINMAETPFYRMKNPNKNHPDNFTEDELNLIGLGYDRMVRFMEKDDPDLKHPYDWYKYGEFGPYSWRGLVVGEPIRGRFSDECVTMYSEVKDNEEWEKIEQFEMEVDYGERLKQMDKDVGYKHYWVFVRHPKWRLNERPWEQWTLVSEVVVEAAKTERLDKWNLMGRLGNKARKLIAQCAGWFRPDIVYVKRPVFQCRFEPQEGFFRGLLPYLDPMTEREYMVELRNEEDGTVEMCTYYEGLCKIVRVSQKAFVDDVVNAYSKLSEEKKSRCLEFLLGNHPVQLLHPYTKEWKAKLEEMELGCDAPDDDDDESYEKNEKAQFTDWIEDDREGEDDQDDVILDMEMGGDEESDLGSEGEDFDDKEEGEEDERYWEKQFERALSSADAMENLAKKSIERNTKFFNEQLKAMEEQEKSEDEAEDGDETALRGVRAKVSPEEWKTIGVGKWRKRIKKSRIPPQLFLRAAVRPFTYRNLVKEIVLTRHAILDGDIGRKE